MITNKQNCTIYNVIFNIEIGLRELIISEMSIIDSNRWYKRRIPGDIYDKCKDKMKLEKNIPWTQYIDHHPIYFTDFSDLEKIISRKDNWLDCFEKIFKNKNIFQSWSRTLEPIRNKIAHNRIASEEDQKIADSIFLQIKTCIGEEKLTTLILNKTIAKSIPRLMEELMDEITFLHKSILSFQAITATECWNTIKDKWWFDVDYLGSNELTTVTDFYGMCNEYVLLPRARGSGHIIESWVSNNYHPDIYKKAIECLVSFLREKK